MAVEITVHQYARIASGLAIFESRLLQSSPTGAFGPGVYVTDLAPRLRSKEYLSRTIYDQSVEYSQSKVADGE